MISLKIKRFLCLLGLVGCMCILFSGCVCDVTEVQINADGSGSARAFGGLPYSYVSDMGLTEEDLVGELGEGYVELLHNGAKYYGNWSDAISFTDICAVDSFEFETTADSSITSSGLDLEYFVVTRVDGGFRLEINLNGIVNSILEDEDALADLENMDADEKLVLDMMLTSCIDLVYTFPHEMKLVSGSESNAVRIDGSKVSISVVEFYREVIDGTLVQGNVTNLVFLPANSGPFIGESEIHEPSGLLFDDVAPSAWYYDAVASLSTGGLVNGVGNNKFNPNGTLTIAEFCQILARATGLETGADASGYWAGKAIRACMLEGYIVSVGDITPANYNVPITREVAVTAMLAASRGRLELADLNITEDDIPDYDKISSQYQFSILEAYKGGLTSGMDDKGTFNPQGVLTRAQICQLFYNLGWNKPL